MISGSQVEGDDLTSDVLEGVHSMEVHSGDPDPQGDRPGTTAFSCPALVEEYWVSSMVLVRDAVQDQAAPNPLAAVALRSPAVDQAGLVTGDDSRNEAADTSLYKIYG